MLSGEEPGKQKTRRPERRGITRAVSPKKIGRRKKGMSKLRNVGEKGDPGSKPVRSKRAIVAVAKVTDDGARAPFAASSVYYLCTMY